MDARNAFGKFGMSLTMTPLICEENTILFVENHSLSNKNNAQVTFCWSGSAFVKLYTPEQVKVMHSGQNSTNFPYLHV